MKPILTDEEVTKLCELARGHEHTWGMFVRAIEAEILRKIGEPVAWCIHFQSQDAPAGFVSTNYHSVNAIADYKVIDPNATLEPLYTLPLIKD